jgi:hypothetical protein
MTATSTDKGAMPGGMAGISATEPDWSREAKPMFAWVPSRSLLASIRAYQRVVASRNPWHVLLRKVAVLRHRFWSVVTGADIPLGCRIGGGLLLPHPNGVVEQRIRSCGEPPPLVARRAAETYKRTHEAQRPIPAGVCDAAGATLLDRKHGIADQRNDIGVTISEHREGAVDVHPPAAGIAGQQRQCLLKIRYERGKRTRMHSIAMRPSESGAMWDKTCGVALQFGL